MPALAITRFAIVGLGAATTMGATFRGVIIAGAVAVEGDATFEDTKIVSPDDSGVIANAGASGSYERRSRPDAVPFI